MYSIQMVQCLCSICTWYRYQITCCLEYSVKSVNPWKTSRNFQASFRENGSPPLPCAMLRCANVLRVSSKYHNFEWWSAGKGLSYSIIKVYILYPDIYQGCLKCSKDFFAECRCTFIFWNLCLFVCLCYFVLFCFFHMENWGSWCSTMSDQNSPLLHKNYLKFVEHK